MGLGVFEMNLRKALHSDVALFFNWRNNPWLLQFSTGRNPVTLEEHQEWFDSVLENSKDHLLLVIISDDERPAGALRFDRSSHDDLAVSIYLTKEFTGKGLGVKALEKGCQQAFEVLRTKSIRAFVREDNSASMSAFQKAGFKLVQVSADCPVHHKEMRLSRT